MPKLTFRIGCAVAIAALVASGSSRADEKTSDRVIPFAGSFSYSIQIAAPPFHGLEPRLALGYSSEGRNGLAGVGWTLGGFSRIERANAGRGTPRFDSSDIYLLDGQELVACVAGSVSPSCTSGGSHATKIESYLKIKLDSSANTWTVYGRDGTKTTFSAMHNETAGTVCWGQASVVDIKSNTVSYGWSCVGGDCYPSSVAYNGYQVVIYRESRPDALSFASVTSIGQTLYRIKSIFVQLGTTPIRAYKLSYGTSAVTGRSLLTSVQTYGKDVVQDGSGGITGGTSLPPVTFTYQTDSNGKTFQPWTGGTE